MLKNILQFLKKSISKIYYLMMGIILLLLIFIDKHVQYPCMNVSLFPNIFLLIVGIIILAFLVIIVKKRKKERDINVISLLKILSIVLFVIQIFLIYNIYFKTGWDVQTMQKVSESLAVKPGVNISAGYFKIYPNNALLLFILTICCKISLFFSLPSYVCALVLGAVLVNCSVLLVGLTLYKICQNRLVAILGYTIATLLIGISPWLCISYSDVFSVLLPILTIYTYLCIRNSKLHFMIKIFMVFIIPCVGYLIKPQNIIVLIAIIIWEVMHFERRNLTLKKMSLIFISCLLVIGGIYSMSSVAQKYTGIVKDDNLRLGFTHFAMMGINPIAHGVYTNDDVVYSLSFIGTQNKRNANIQMIKTRLKDMGVIGFAKHMVKKTLVNYNDGMFGWGAEGNFYLEVPPEPLGEISTVLRNIYYNGGKYYSLFSSFEQMIWILVLFLSFFGAIMQKVRTKSRIENIAMLSIIGLTLFTAIFEARARYLFLYAPVYVLCGMIGLHKICIWVANRKVEKRRIEDCETEKIC